MAKRILTTDDRNLLENYITPKMFGAVGDGVTDDTAAINEAIVASVNDQRILFFDADQYYCAGTLVFENTATSKSRLFVMANKAKIITGAEVGARIKDHAYHQGKIDSLYIYGGENTKIGVQVEYTNNFELNSFKIQNFTEKGLYVVSGVELMATYGYISNDTDNDAFGIYTEAGDSHYQNIIIRDVFTDIYSGEFNYFSMIHAWNYNLSLLNKATRFYTGTLSSFTNCQSDTVSIAFELKTPYYVGAITEFKYLINGKIANAEAPPTECYIFRFTDGVNQPFFSSVNGLHITIFDEYTGTVYFSNLPQEKDDLRLTWFSNERADMPYNVICQGTVENLPPKKLVFTSPETVLENWKVIQYEEVWTNGFCHVYAMVQSEHGEALTTLKTAFKTNHNNKTPLTYSCAEKAGQYSPPSGLAYVYYGAGGGVGLQGTGTDRVYEMEFTVPLY